MNTAFKVFVVSLVLLMSHQAALHGQDTGLWARFEKEFKSAKDYDNPIYDQKFTVRFTSPSGKVKSIPGFWDGNRIWKVRFMPDENGTWTWKADCSDKSDNGLNGLSGSFKCVENNRKQPIFSKGAVTRTPGLYHLEHNDGTPFFWAACTAWNGTLKSTEEEWKYYLNNRVANHYTVVQFVTTQWRGGDKNSMGQVAFDGSGVIHINPEFFQHLDKKVDQINEVGLVAAPVLLWALPAYRGRFLSPGYYLPEEEAILLARYMVARYGGNHVVWILGGDGKYLDAAEQRWKNIGRGVFGDEHPGLVALHPSGRMWLGEAYGDEDWLDIVGYQTGHSNAQSTLEWVTNGPVANRWDRLPPKVLINMEPVYEEIRPEITAGDVRNASYWSILSTPTAGITYGANGIWPWLREGELILNHGYTGEKTSRWKASLDLPGSVQVGYLSSFFQTLEWWKLKPVPELLQEQPGKSETRKFISVSRSDDRATIVAYVPVPQDFSIYVGEERYEGQWFDTVTGKTTKATLTYKNSALTIARPLATNDHLLVLKKK